jgi:hypothetical protein
MGCLLSRLFTRTETAAIYVGDEDAGKAIANFFKKEYPGYKIKVGDEVIQLPGERKDRIF